MERPEPGLSHIYGWFLELSQARAITDTGPQAIPWSEVEAWARLTARRLAPYELRALRVLDATYLRIAYKRRG